MEFARVFPATTWVWRHGTGLVLHQFRSRRARRIWLTLLLIVAVPAIALRIQAAFFQYRVVHATNQLSAIQMGKTTKAELLTRMPELKPCPKKIALDGSDQCFEYTIPYHSFPSLAGFLARHELSLSTKMYATLHLWGFRDNDFRAYIYAHHGKAQDLRYDLLVSEGSGFAPGHVWITVHSDNRRKERKEFGGGAETFWIQGTSVFTWMNARVLFTARANPECIRQAFEPHLSCVWSLTGCWAANQVLPLAEPARARQCQTPERN